MAKPNAAAALLFLVVVLPEAQAVNQEGVYLLQAKRALRVPDGALGDWNPRDATPCAWTGVSCDGGGAVTALSLPGLNLAGPFPGAALCRIPRLRSVDLSDNYIGPGGLGGSSLVRCAALQHLDLSMNSLVGPLPDAVAELPELVYLNLQSNNLSGPIPASFGRFRKLESLSLVYNLLGGQVPAFLGGVSTLRELNLSYNPFAAGPVPGDLPSSLRVLWLAGCNLVGAIPSSLGRLGNLTDLDLSGNRLSGSIPADLANLRSAVQMELYNNSLWGPIPRGFGGLRSLRALDLAMNNLTGAIPEDLFQAPSLQILHLYANALTGPVPASAAEATSLSELRLFANRLNGTLPSGLGRAAPLVCVDVSDNHDLSGEIPPGVCGRGRLQELLMLDNSLSGRIPDALGRCGSLRRLRLANNRLEGDVPAALWGLPHLSLLELAGNRLTGPISPAIAGAANLTKLLLSHNRLSGAIPSEISGSAKLYELSADGNMLSGPLPASLGALPELGRLVLRNNSLSGDLLQGIEIQNWKKLSELNLADNAFTGSIPPELGDLPVLNYLDLSGNRLSGEVPAQLENLKLNQLNVSDNDLRGPLPPQYATQAYRSSFLGNPGLCGQIAGLCSDSSSDDSMSRSFNHAKWTWMMRSIFVFAAAVLVAGVAWFIWRYRSFSASRWSKRRAERSKWTLTSFHKLPFSEYEILDCLDDEEDNVIGSGASGKVYKAVLSNGDVVAVKKLWPSSASDDGSFEAEVRTLGKIRHKNIVKLLCCCVGVHRERECKLLVYEYMANGSLGDALHSGNKGTGLLLDWATRYRIAVDAAEGLSYLHHDCAPPIVHRDVKSNNILLDAGFGARVADFGVAKAVEVEEGAGPGRPPKSMSVIAGSCGYIAPEYAYTLRVTEKSDTYSFGVVLLELVTGKPPVFGEKDLVNWVCSTVEHKGVDHVLDARLALDMAAGFKDHIVRVLNIALLCASSLPINRPPMRTVVKMLHDLRPADAAAAAAAARPPRLLVHKLSPYNYFYDDAASDQGSSA